MFPVNFASLVAWECFSRVEIMDIHLSASQSCCARMWLEEEEALFH